MFKALQNYFLKYPFSLVVRNRTKPPKGGKGRCENAGARSHRTGNTTGACEGRVTARLPFSFSLKKKFFLELKHGVGH